MSASLESVFVALDLQPKRIEFPFKDFFVDSVIWNSHIFEADILSYSW